ncbi:hypothetical protein A3F06_03120 [candidate division TM6 bacterium RIFCSPHIGHO2_12_FULL_36_22]|nr:MAG: hypothetical protein A3F06_03120 [candidate division TM6 bacterium RIFCSPHIGHO2_12_FULL_36_22]
MNIKWFALISILVFLPACLNNTNQTSSLPKSSFFIQAPLELDIVKELHTSMKRAVDTILQEEIGATELIVSPQEKYAIFFTKRRQAITTYYVYDIHPNGEPLLFTALDNIKASAPQDVTLGSHITFFGDTNRKMIDLVMFIDDPKKELLQLNKDVKQAAHKANQEYKKTHKVDLYDFTKSEHFPYLPHLSLGHLRTKEIRELVKDKSKADETIESIKQRIIQAISQEVSKIVKPNNKKISITSLAVYDASKRKYIRTINLSLP